jgi:hypothetical protein
MPAAASAVTAVVLPRTTFPASLTTYQVTSRAREYQIDRVDVNYSPVRFDPVLHWRN